MWCGNSLAEPVHLMDKMGPGFSQKCMEASVKWHYRETIPVPQLDRMALYYQRCCKALQLQCKMYNPAQAESSEVAKCG